MIPHHLDFKRLKRLVTLEKVLASMGLLSTLSRRGHRWVGPCPIHRGDNPNAFTIHRERNLWKCFTRCDAGGDVVELVRRLQGGSYKAAALYLADLAQNDTLQKPTSGSPIRPNPFRPFTPRLTLDSTAPYLVDKGIRPPIARHFQVGAFHGRGMLENCIAVRLFDLEGEPIGYAGRHLDPQIVATRGKWKFPYRLPRNRLLYGYHHTPNRHHTGLVLVEGPWDVLRLAQLGIPAVALFGVHLSARQQEILHPLANLVVLMDGDKAGRHAAVTIHQKLPNSKVISLPEGLDPDDLADLDLVRIGEHLTLF